MTIKLLLCNDANNHLSIFSWHAVMRDGVVSVEPYRMLNAFGDWYWVTTEAFLSYTPNGESKKLKCRDQMLG